MGRMFFARFLGETSHPQPKPKPDVVLEPIEPGAWAAWAKSHAEETTPTVAPDPSEAATPDPRAGQLAQLPSQG